MTETAQPQATKINREAVIASMKRVISLESGSPERWRAAYRHFLKQRPEAAYEANFVAKKVQERKVMINKFGSTKYGRMTMATPSFLLGVLKNTDPEYFIPMKPMDLISTKHLTKMQRAFPEFFVPEVI